MTQSSSHRVPIEINNKNIISIDEIDEFFVCKIFLVARAFFRYKVKDITKNYYRKLRYTTLKTTSKNMYKKLKFDRSMTVETMFEKCAIFFSQQYNLLIQVYDITSLFQSRNPSKRLINECRNGISDGILTFFKHYEIYHYVIDENLMLKSKKRCLHCHTFYKTSHEACSQFCSECGVNISQHLQSNPVNRIKKYCEKCRHFFSQEQCFDLHLKKTSLRASGLFQSTCVLNPRCNDCGTRHSIIRNCDFKRNICSLCSQVIKQHPKSIEDIHSCFIMPIKSFETPPVEFFHMVFYDIETIVLDHTLELEANMICFQIYQLDDMSSKKTKFISKKCFKGKQCISDFIDYFFPVSPVEDLFKNTSFLCHNGGRFDVYFILKQMFRSRPIFKPIPIQRGSTFYCIKYAGNRFFFDTCKIIPSALKSFTNTFDIQEVKGFFPHLFNRPKNYDYEGSIPDKSFFEPNSFKTQSELDNFLSWYDSQANVHWKFMTELEKYCHADVDILSKGFLKFHDFILSKFNVQIFSPLRNSNVFTLASLSMFIFRARFYKTPPLMLNIPHMRRTKQYSMSSVRYFQSLPNHHDLYHVGNFNGEIKIGPFHVDAFCPKTKTVYEYLGCYFHGHGVDCRYTKTRGETNTDFSLPRSTFGSLIPEHSARTPKISVFSSFKDRLSYTMMRENMLKSWGYKVNSVWECEVESSHSSPFPLTKQKKKLLDPGQCVRGGRTEVFQLYYKAEKVSSSSNVEIEYVDVTSLYPYILSNSEFPVGQVSIDINNLSPDSFSRYDSKMGIADIEVLPPRDLKIPLLPFNSTVNSVKSMKCQKVFFPLCRSCVENVILETKGCLFIKTQINEAYQVLTPIDKVSINETCNHSNINDRLWRGVYTLTEIRLAIELGYKLINVFEVWYFKETSDNIFSPYIKQCFKIKLENSGFPNHVKNDNDKHIFIEKIRDLEGIELSADEIVKNPTGRNIGKLLANSFFGKFIQKSYSKTVYAMNKSEARAIFLDAERNGKVVECINIIDGDFVSISIAVDKTSGCEDEENVPCPNAESLSKYGNVIIGATVTSLGRIHLYKLMTKLNPDALIFVDTDSICYKVENGKRLIVEDGMGKLKDEIVDEFGNGSRLIEVVALAPKCYSLKIVKSDGNISESLKNKGYCKTVANASILNFDSTKEMIFNSELEKQSVFYREFKRDKNIFSIFDFVKEKKVVACFDKRIVDLKTLKTVPIGYYNP